MQENRLLEQQLRQPRREFRPSVRPESQVTPKHALAVHKKDSLKEGGEEGWALFLEEQYSRSKVMRLYNFIQRELPICQTCLQPKQHLVYTPFVSFACAHCRAFPSAHYHPAMAVLYDLENRPRFEDELGALGKIL